MISLVIPVYNEEENLPALRNHRSDLNRRYGSSRHLPG